MTINIVRPNVKLLASTGLEIFTDEDLFKFDEDGNLLPVTLCGMELQEDSTAAEDLTVFAGRSCYNSFHRPSPATFRDEDYLRRTIFEQGHGSILEHASATVYITGVSRAFLTELTRHRHLSFSVQSQRFVDESDCNVVIPPAIRDHYYGSDYRDAFLSEANEAVERYKEWVAELMLEDDIDPGNYAPLPRKQAREAARAALPNCVETRMVVTGNLRAWMQVLDRRLKPDVDAEMREVMELVRQQLETVSPVIFRKGNYS